jgi:hypothetical protein
MNAARDVGARFRWRRQREVARRNRRHVDGQIDAVEQRPRQLCLIFLGATGRATARPARLRQVAAAARVHRRDELDARREGHMPVGASDADPPGFERLTQRFERGSTELGQFVEKEHPLVSQGDFARSRADAAANQRRQRGRMVGVAKWPLAQQRAAAQAAGRR